MFFAAEAHSTRNTPNAMMEYQQAAEDCAKLNLGILACNQPNDGLKNIEPGNIQTTNQLFFHSPFAVHFFLL